jgi:hypothetical protein
LPFAWFSWFALYGRDLPVSGSSRNSSGPLVAAGVFVACSFFLYLVSDCAPEKRVGFEVSQVEITKSRHLRSGEV